MKQIKKDKYYFIHTSLSFTRYLCLRCCRKDDYVCAKHNNAIAIDELQALEYGREYINNLKMKLDIQMRNKEDTDKKKINVGDKVYSLCFGDKIHPIRLGIYDGATAHCAHSIKFFKDNTDLANNDYYLVERHNLDDIFLTLKEATVELLKRIKENETSC